MGNLEKQIKYNFDVELKRLAYYDRFPINKDEESKLTKEQKAAERNSEKEKYLIYPSFYTGNNATLIRYAYGPKHLRENRNHFIDIIVNINDLVRRYQYMFFNCIVLMFLKPKKYELLTIDCKKYREDDIVINNIYAKEVRRNGNLHFFRHSGSKDLFDYIELEKMCQNAYLKMYKNSPPEFESSYEKNEYFRWFPVK
jgi:hypothetical protein